MMKATAFEYKHRYLIHGTIYMLAFAAPWRLPVWGFVNNGSSWFLLSNQLSKPLYQQFAVYWNVLLVVMIVFALAGAALRTWGAAYLGATTVQRGGMVGDRVIADGPYRYTRNPLYLGTLLNTIAIAFLMRPEAAVFCIVFIALVQVRLIGREEPYLLESMGPAYAAYLAAVPRLLPSLTPRTQPGTHTPNWRQGVLSEIYVIGVAISIAAFGWSQGYGWENSIVHIMQGMIVSLGIAVMARAFIPKATF